METSAAMQLATFIRDKFSETDGGVSVGQLRDELLDDHPELVRSFLSEKLTTILGQEISNILAHMRINARNRAVASTYKEGFDRIKEGDVEARSIFDIPYFVNSDQHIHKRLGELTKRDHLAIAERYTARGNRVLMYAALHKEIARKVGNKRTEDVFTEEQLDKLFAQYELTPEEAARAAA